MKLGSVYIAAVGTRSLNGINTPDGLRALSAAVNALADEKQREMAPRQQTGT